MQGAKREEWNLPHGLTGVCSRMKITAGCGSMIFASANRTASGSETPPRLFFFNLPPSSSDTGALRFIGVAVRSLLKWAACCALHFFFLGGSVRPTMGTPLPPPTYIAPCLPPSVVRGEAEPNVPTPRTAAVLGASTSDEEDELEDSSESLHSTCTTAGADFPLTAEKWVLSV